MKPLAIEEDRAGGRRMTGQFDGVYTYVTWHKLEEYLAQGWEYMCPVSVWACIMRAPV